MPTPPRTAGERLRAAVYIALVVLVLIAILGAVALQVGYNSTPLTVTTGMVFILGFTGVYRIVQAYRRGYIAERSLWAILTTNTDTPSGGGSGK